MRRESVGHRSKSEYTPLAWVYEFGGAAIGFLLVTACAFVLLPVPPPDALKSVQEAHGVYAVLIGLSGLVAGGWFGSWAAKAVSRQTRPLTEQPRD